MRCPPVVLTALAGVALSSGRIPAQDRTSGFEYATKFICGAAPPLRSAPGRYFTEVNVHNPGPETTRFSYKVALTGRDARGDTITGLATTGLYADQALTIGCREIARMLQALNRPATAEGFLVIIAPSELDVVAVYTAGPDRVATMDVERVPPRRLTMAPGGSCLDFQSLTPFPQTFAGPTFVIPPLDFTNPKNPNGTAIPIQLTDRGEDLDGRPELYVGFSRDSGGYQPLFATFPQGAFPAGVRTASIELRHFNSATVLALGTGGVISQATQSTQNTRVTLNLSGPSIRRIQFNTIETLVYRICWTI